MLKDYALHYYEQGYNCAESLVYGANVAWHLNLDENACHLMAGLGGGLQVGDGVRRTDWSRVRAGVSDRENQSA